MDIEFEWDLAKELINIAKHDVDFLEAQGSFFDPAGLQLIDFAHSHDEQRYFWVGQSSQGQVLTTRFVYRDGKIRIIGSAKWRKFRRMYEAAKNVRGQNRPSGNKKNANQDGKGKKNQDHD